MKTLYMLRHGKSDWNNALPDHERTLAPRGIDAAQRIGRLLRDLDEVPDRIVASTAVRARETVRLAGEAGEDPTRERRPKARLRAPCGRGRESGRA